MIFLISYMCFTYCTHICIYHQLLLLYHLSSCVLFGSKGTFLFLADGFIFFHNYHTGAIWCSPRNKISRCHWACWYAATSFNNCSLEEVHNHLCCDILLAAMFYFLYFWGLYYQDYNLNYYASCALMHKFPPIFSLLE